MKKTFILSLMALILVLTIAGCGVKEQVINAQEDAGYQEKILIHGLLENDFEITLLDLKQLPTITKHAEAPRSNGDMVIVDATGPLMDSFLEQYNKTQKDFSRIRFTAKDQYSIAVPADVLANRQIILAYQNEGKPLDAEMQPIRIIVPDERAMYWVRNLVRIDFETGGDQQSPNKVVFLDAAAGKLQQQDYEYYDNIDQTITTKDLITQFADINDQTVTNVFLKASDGLQKNETRENFLSGMLKITGQESPKFVAHDLPQGMHTRDIVYIIYGETAIVNYSTAITYLPLKNELEHEGIAFSELFKQTGLVGGTSYRLTCLDESISILSINDLGSGGLIYQNEFGTLSFICTGSSGLKNIDHLLSIEVMK